MRARAWGGGSMSTLRDVSGGLLVLCCVTAGCADDLSQTVLPDGGLAPRVDEVSGYDAFDGGEGDRSSTPSSEGGLSAEASGPETGSTSAEPAALPGPEMQGRPPEGTPDAGAVTSTAPADPGTPPQHNSARSDADAASPSSGPTAVAADSGANTTIVGAPTPVVPLPPVVAVEEQTPSSNPSQPSGDGPAGPSVSPQGVDPAPVTPAQPPVDPLPPAALPTSPISDAPPATPQTPAAPAEAPPSALSDPAPPTPSAPSDPAPPTPPPPPDVAPQTPEAPPQPTDPPSSASAPDAGTSVEDAGPLADAAAEPDDPPSYELDAGANEPFSDAGQGSDGQDAGTQLVPLLDAGSPSAPETPDTGAGLAACEACSANSCTHQVYGGLLDYCRTLSDVALDGTRAGEARSQLCMDLLSCTRRTRCAVEDPVDCLCGATSQESCLEEAPLATGPCAAEAIAATETTDDYDMVDRLLDYRYPSGAALNLAVCESTFCASVCP